MTTFDDRERGEETKFSHDLEIAFKVRNRRNKLFGLWVASEHLSLAGESATAYAKDVVMADFESHGNGDMLGKVKADLARVGHSVSDHALEKHLRQFEGEAHKQVMAE